MSGLGNGGGYCVACLADTERLIGFDGDAEWIIAQLHALVGLGVASSLAEQLFQEQCGTDPGMAPEGRVKVTVQVCAACLESTRFKGRARGPLDGNEVHYVSQP